MLTSALLLIADSRLPTGGHAHSGGVEAAIRAGLISSLDELEAFLLGRLHTVGHTSAALAATACRMARGDLAPGWPLLDAEADARTPSPAARAASRAQGRALARLGRGCWPHPAWTALGGSPHHACALGVAGAACGALPREAALLCLQANSSGPASAALRLLGFDPAAVTAVLTRLAPIVDLVASEADEAADRAGTTLAALPCRSAPLLDVHAEQHSAAEVRLFAS